MRLPTSRRSWAFTLAALVLLTCLVHGTLSWSAAQQGKDPAKKAEGMTPTKKAQALGIKFDKVEPRYLNHCVKSGKLLFTSGFGSKTKGRLGKELKVEDGRKAARECAVEILQAVHDRHGT